MIGWKTWAKDWSTASARLRCFLPCQFLQEAGWPSELFHAERVDQYRCVVFQKAYTAGDVELAARLRQKGCRIIFDLCDNLFYQPLDFEENVGERVARLREMIALADAVSVPTASLAALTNHRNTAVIDDAVDGLPLGGMLNPLARAGGLARRILSPRARLVWFGNAGTLDPPSGLADLGAIIPQLNRLNQTMRISLSVISNSRELFRQRVRGAEFPLHYFEWDRRRFRALFLSHEICLLPVAQNPFTLCKSNNRVLLALLLGLPVIADRIPSYEEFSPFVLFSNWPANVQLYLRDQNLRQWHVAAAREYIRREYTPARVVRQWSELFKSVLAGSPDSAPARKSRLVV